MRWIEVVPSGSSTSIARNIDADHATLKSAGVDVDAEPAYGCR
jgi:hypothetical protein